MAWNHQSTYIDLELKEDAIQMMKKIKVFDQQHPQPWKDL
jgi:hypothetical protein